MNRASKVITKLNPEGHPPPGVSSPTMMNLIDRLEISRNEDRPSYASVLRSSSSTSSPASVQSYRGSVLTEDRSSSDEHEVTVPTDVQSLKSASSRKRKAPPKGKVQKTSKKTVSFFTLDMERTLATNSQYAVSTVQETSALPRRVGSKEIILTNRLGDFHKGRKTITSSALNKSASSTTSTAIASSGSKDVIDLEASMDDNSSDDKDAVHDYRQEQYDDVLCPKMMVNQEPSRQHSKVATAIASSGSKDVIDFGASIDDNSSDDEDAVHDYRQEQHDDMLFPRMTVNQEPSRRHSKVASLQDKDHAALTSKAVDETDISDASSDYSVIGYELPAIGSSSTPAHLLFTAQETSFLNKGSNGALFYAHVKPVGDMLG